MLDIFTSNIFDNKISVINNNEQYTYKDIKELIACKIGVLKRYGRDTSSIGNGIALAPESVKSCRTANTL